MKHLQLQPGDIVKYAPIGELAILDAPYGFTAEARRIFYAPPDVIKTHGIVPHAVGLVVRIIPPKTAVCIFPPQVGRHLVHINDLILLQKGRSKCEGGSANADALPASPCADRARGEDT